MKILVLNCGSSSIKYKLFQNNLQLTEGLIERIGEKGARVKTYRHGIKLMVERLLASRVIKNLGEIKAVGHRVVHGGNLSMSCIIDEKVLKTINKFSPLAPLHNPSNLMGILETRKILPNVPHVAVFDTAFHQAMPERAHVYALPYEFYKKYGIRRYGFHGTSHKYVAQRAAELLGKPFNKLNLITCHLGAGCSITAIEKGKVIDTSMGFTPLEGLVMGTRPGDIDAGILIYLSEKLKINANELDRLLNEKSGLLGISGISKDFRTILACSRKGNKRCKLALDIFCYKLKKYVGAYAAALGNVDAIVFTAGIGENHFFVRECISGIECLNIKIDSEKNRRLNGKEGIVSDSRSGVKVLVIPTDEEKMICLETARLLN